MAERDAVLRQESTRIRAARHERRRHLLDCR
jgi:hypothetical protein